MDDLAAALDKTGFADRVRLDSRIILARGSKSLADIAAIDEAGFYEALDPRPGEVELELGGVVVARGRLVRKGGSTMLRITAMGEEA